MGVKIRKRGGKWYVFVNYHGQRKAKCVGPSRQIAEQVRRQLEAKLALGDLGFLADKPTITFGEYAERWLKTDANKVEGFYRKFLPGLSGPLCPARIWRNETRRDFARSHQSVYGGLEHEGAISQYDSLGGCVLASRAQLGCRGWFDNHESGVPTRQIHGESEARA